MAIFSMFSAATIKHRSLWEALSRPVHQWHSSSKDFAAGKPRKRRSIWARLKLEAEPFGDFLEICAGKPFAETSIALFKNTLADCFGSWEKTKKTLR